VPQSSVMKSRRLMGLPKAKDEGLTIAGQGHASQQKRPTHVRDGSFASEPAEAAHPCTSAAPPKPDVNSRSWCPTLCAKSGGRGSGTVQPSILAVWWLMTGSYVVSASTGRSAGTSASGRQPRSIRRSKAVQPDSEQFRSSPRTSRLLWRKIPQQPKIGHVSDLRRRVPTWRGQNKKIDAPLNARFRQT